MKNVSVAQPLNWMTKNWFEDACLSIDESSGQTCPLFHAAALGLDELSVLLMKNGATPQGSCFLKISESRQPYRGTVLSRLIASTMNTNNEVQNLITDAASLNVGHIVTLQAMNAILSLDPHPGDHISWRSGTLLWNHSLKWHRDYKMQLWQGISMADISQVRKISDPKSIFTIVIEAAWRRPFWAVRTLLDLGLSPNGCGSRWKFWQLKVTARDVIAWTSSVSAADCEQSGPYLKERDAEIIDLLQSRGGIWGVEYRTEYFFSDRCNPSGRNHRSMLCDILNFPLGS